MPRYQITAPDGRVVTIEGPRPPTQEDAAKIFADLPAPKGIPRDTLSGRRKPAPQEVDAPRDAGGLLADMALEGGGAAGGQALGAYAAPYTYGLSIPVGGAIGGVAGNLASQKRRILAGEQRGYRPGEALASLVTGAIPGAPLAATGGKAMLREGAKQAAGGILARTIETGVDEGRFPSAQEFALVSALPAVGGAIGQRMQAANPEIAAAVADAATKGATERATIRAAREAGYKIPPSDIRPGPVTDALSSFGGKAALAQQATIQNQEVTNNLAKRILGIPEKQDITPELLTAIRKDAAKPYEEIEKMASKAASDEAVLKRATTGMSAHETAALQADPKIADELRSLGTQAAADVKAWREALQKRNAYYEDYRRNKTVAALESARANEGLAESLSDKIEAAALEIGRPELANQLKEARTKIAQSHDIERALNESNADVRAVEIGKALRRGAPLTDELKTIADFDNAFGQRLTREAAKVPAAGVSALNPIGATLATVGGGAALGPAGAALGLYPLLRGPVRSALLSGPYQKYATELPLMVNASPDRRAVLARALTQEGAQEIADEVEPKKKK